jgi:hypothetical protein
MDADDSRCTGTYEESTIDTPTFAFTSNVDLCCVVADSISTLTLLSITMSVPATAPYLHWSEIQHGLRNWAASFLTSGGLVRTRAAK